MIRKIRPDAYLCRSSHFGVNDDNDRRTKRLLYPLLRMRARGNYSVISTRRPESNEVMQFSVLHRGTLGITSVSDFKNDAHLSACMQCTCTILLDLG